MSFLKKHKGEDKVKVEFTITLHALKDLPKPSIGNDIFIEFKQGSKSENHKTTKKVKADEATVSFEEKIKICCSFHKNPKTNKLETKRDLLITVKEEEKGKKETIGKAVVSLTQYADNGTIRHDSVTIVTKAKEKRSPAVTLKIESVWLKLNNQSIVKKEEGKATTTPSKTIEIGDTEFGLKTADDHTETNASVSDEEEKINFESGDEENNKDQKKKDKESKNKDIDHPDDKSDKSDKSEKVEKNNKTPSKDLASTKTDLLTSSELKFLKEKI